MTINPPPNKDREEEIKERQTQRKEEERFSEHRSTESLMDYFKAHTRETIAYVLLVIGIILLFFNPLYGGTLVGIVAGIYLSDEIVFFLKNCKKDFETHRVSQNLIYIGIIIAFFISAPAIFLGAAIAIAIKQLFIGPGNLSEESKKPLDSETKDTPKDKFPNENKPL